MKPKVGLLGTHQGGSRGKGVERTKKRSYLQAWIQAPLFIDGEQLKNWLVLLATRYKASIFNHLNLCMGFPYSLLPLDQKPLNSYDSVRVRILLKKRRAAILKQFQFKLIARVG